MCIVDDFHFSWEVRIQRLCLLMLTLRNVFQQLCAHRMLIRERSVSAAAGYLYNNLSMMISSKDLLKWQGKG